MTLREASDKFTFGLWLMAGALILFMLVSLFYLFVAVGGSWSLVVKALFDNRIIGALLVSVSSAFIVGVLAIGVAIPTAYVLTYSKFRGKSLVETLLIEFPQTFPPATVGLVYLLMLGPGSPINIAYTYLIVIFSFHDRNKEGVKRVIEEHILKSSNVGCIRMFKSIPYCRKRV